VAACGVMPLGLGSSLGYRSIRPSLKAGSFLLLLLCLIKRQRTSTIGVLKVFPLGLRTVLLKYLSKTYTIRDFTQR
jgi:hypothetical protein